MAGSWTRSTFKLTLIISVAAALLIVLGGWLPAYLANVRLAREIAELQAVVARSYGSGRSFDEAQSDVEKQREDLRSRLQDVRKAVEFVPDERRFSLPAGAARLGLEYSKVRDRIESDLRDAAARAGVAVPPSLDPRGTATTPPDEEAAAMLYRFAMNERIARAAIQAKLARIESLRYDLKKLDQQGADSFMRAVQVEATVKGSLEAVARFLHALQERGSFFVPRKITIAPDAPPGSLLKAVFVLEALRVNPDGKFPEEMPTVGPGGMLIPPPSASRTPSPLPQIY